MNAVDKLPHMHRHVVVVVRRSSLVAVVVVVVVVVVMIVVEVAIVLVCCCCCCCCCSGAGWGRLESLHKLGSGGFGGSYGSESMVRFEPGYGG